MQMIASGQVLRRVQDEGAFQKEFRETINDLGESVEINFGRSRP